MTKTRIGQLTKVVIQRLNMLTCSHQAILVERERCDTEFLSLLLCSMEAEGFGFSPFHLAEEKPPTVSVRAVRCENILSAAEIGTFSALTSAHEVTVIGDLSIAELTAFRDLRVEGPLLSLAYETLRQGKKVYALSRDLEVQGHNPGLRRKVDEMTAELEYCGLVLLTRSSGRGVRLDKSVVTLQDVCNIEFGPVVVEHGTSFTTTAKQALDARGVHVIWR